MAILDKLKKDKGASQKADEGVKEEKNVEEVKKKEDKKQDSPAVSKLHTQSLHHIIKHPRITEKAAILSGDGVYTFEIDPKATKIDVARAIKAIYKVDPVKIAISKLPAKRKIIRGKRGKTAAVKKAVVYLKKGDTIEFV
jgi:large subunit ribosomal protein L23